MKKKSKKKKYHVLLILLLIVAGIFLLIEEFGKEDRIRKLKPKKKPEVIKPETRPKKILPKVAIVIDDLGTNRQSGEEVLAIKSPLTLSILPRQIHTDWVAEEGHRLGRDIMVHIPMEAAKPHKLGEGGLYTWMSDAEIIQTVEEDIRSVPHAKGVNNHMGSGFTKDERGMLVVINTLKKHRLFFLDSLTTPDSVGFKLARAQGLKTGSRDIFLDDADDLKAIEIQWNKLLREARQRGHAIAIGHPRKNTLQFLRKVLRDNKEITVVPLSALLVE